MTVIATGLGQRPDVEGAHAGEKAQIVRVTPHPFDRSFKRREIPAVDGEARISVEACLDVDYDTPAFLRRHSE